MLTERVAATARWSSATVLQPDEVGDRLQPIVQHALPDERRCEDAKAIARLPAELFECDIRKLDVLRHLIRRVRDLLTASRVALGIAPQPKEISLYAVQATVEGCRHRPLNVGRIRRRMCEQLLGEIAVPTCLIEMALTGWAHSRVKIVLTEDGQAASGSSGKMTCKSMGRLSSCAR